MLQALLCRLDAAHIPYDTAVVETLKAVIDRLRVDVDRKVERAGDTMTGDLAVMAKVGIGTTSPLRRLHVHEPSANSYIRLSNKSDGANNILEFYEGSTLQASLIARGSGIAGGPPNALNIYTAVKGAPITLGTASGEKIRIRDDGKVGINNKTPAAQLDVGGTVQMTGFKMPTGKGAGLVLTSDGAGAGTWKPAISAGWKLQEKNLVSTVSGAVKISGDLWVTGGLKFQGNLKRRVYGGLRANRQTVVLSGNWNELEIKGRVIDWTGSNLHIGFDNNHPLDFIEMGRKVGSLQFLSGGGGSETMRITDGRVGIGTKAPAANAKLDVKGNLRVDGNIAVSGMVLQEEWQKPTLTNGWVRYSSEYNPPAFFIDKNGIVHLRGLVKFGTRAGNLAGTIFTVPPGFRPPFRELNIVMTDTGAGRLDIDKFGRVRAVTGGNRWFSLDGISFRAGKASFVIAGIATVVDPGLVKSTVGFVKPSTIG